ncbi:MAG: LPS assembly protein LptD [Lonepinella koalarum]|nr:LPS assembly protein LptD [Lonepinella koalarum]
MKKNLYSLISLSILTALYSTASQADLQQQCLVGVPHFSGEVIKGDVNNLPVYIEADSAELNQPISAVYQGKVELKQGNRHLQADSVTIQQSTEKTTEAQRYAYIQGGFQYSDNLIQLRGEKADLHLNSKDANIENADYQFVGRQGRGTAMHTELRENHRILKNATFTSCLPDDNAWQIDAAEMKQHIQEEYAEMWHARFKVAGVPIFYTPYLQLPIGDRRRSGLLLPDVGTSSRDGYWYAQPVYWNIAPNYDATFIPKYMSDRGLQLNGEFRYLTVLGEGKIAGEYLSRDHYENYVGENTSRHLFYWSHHAKLWDNWRLNVDYTKVSDRTYFSDFTSEYGNSTDGYATQAARLAYYQPNWHFALSVKQYQVFDNLDIGPYKALPQLDFNYYRDNLLNTNLNFRLFSQAVRFHNDSLTMPTAWRFHIEPSLNLPMASRYGSINVETKLYATHYQQRKGSSNHAEHVEKRINRVLPQVKIDFQTLLANQQSFIEGYTQTLEPRVQYLYRPYKNQRNIGSQNNNSYLGFGYDSSLLQQDYFSLFRDRRYSGLDRIASANQITLGGTTRFYDKNAEERFNLSLGQILYINSSRIDDNEDNNTLGRSSSWAAEANWKINNQWHWRGSYQYDTRLNSTSLANLALEYNPEKHNLVQLNYRYASRDYIDQNLNTRNSYNQSIKQLGITTAWEIDDNWAVVGRYYQDLAINKPVEQYLGVKYNNCCWSVGIGVRRYLINENAKRKYSDTKDTLYDHSIGINFELRGLSNDHRSGIVEMLDKGMLPYVRGFSLE